MILEVVDSSCPHCKKEIEQAERVDICFSCPKCKGLFIAVNNVCEWWNEPKKIIKVG